MDKEDAYQYRRSSFCVNCGLQINPEWKFCPKCGSINIASANISNASVGNRHSTYQETKKSKSFGWAFLLLVTCAFAFLLWTSTQPTDKAIIPAAVASPEPTKKSIPTPTVKPKMQEYEFVSGRYIIKPSAEGICPFTVSVPAGNNYYIYLKYIAEPRKSDVINKDSKKADVSFLVASGKTESIDVPVGIYKLFYAYGPVDNIWYGRKNRFGPDTVYYSSDDLLAFYTDNTYAHGNTLELWLQENGNFDSDKISEFQFPE